MRGGRGRGRKGKGREGKWVVGLFVIYDNNGGGGDNNLRYKYLGIIRMSYLKKGYF